MIYRILIHFLSFREDSLVQSLFRGTLTPLFMVKWDIHPFCVALEEHLFL